MHKEKNKKEGRVLKAFINTIKALPRSFDAGLNPAYQHTYKEELFVNACRQLQEMDPEFDVKKFGKLCGIKNKHILNPDKYVMVMGYYIERVNDIDGKYLIAYDNVKIIETGEEAFVCLIGVRKKKDFIDVLVKSEEGVQAGLMFNHSNAKHVKNRLSMDPKLVRKIWR